MSAEQPQQWIRDIESYESNAAELIVLAAVSSNSVTQGLGVRISELLRHLSDRLDAEYAAERSGRRLFELQQQREQISAGIARLRGTVKIRAGRVSAKYEVLKCAACEKPFVNPAALDRHIANGHQRAELLGGAE